LCRQLQHAACFFTFFLRCSQDCLRLPLHSPLFSFFIAVQGTLQLKGQNRIQGLVVADTAVKTNLTWTSKSLNEPWAAGRLSLLSSEIFEEPAAASPPPPEEGGLAANIPVSFPLPVLNEPDANTQMVPDWFGSPPLSTVSLRLPLHPTHPNSSYPVWMGSSTQIWSIGLCSAACERADTGEFRCSFMRHWPALRCARAACGACVPLTGPTPLGLRTVAAERSVPIPKPRALVAVGSLVLPGY